MNELIKIGTNEHGEPRISGRELHTFLEVKTAYKDWFPRMTEYGFTEGEDFNPLKIARVQNEGGREVSREVIDHSMTIDMAKELCMIQRTERGKQARQYFLAVEKEWNSPEKVMARALMYANKQIASLGVTVQAQAVELEAAKPKVLFADAVAASKSSILIGALAKIIKQNGVDIGQKRLFAWLRENGFLIKSGADKNIPTQRAMEMKLFEVKEGSYIDGKGENVTTRTTKVTGKGQQYFINRFLTEKEKEEEQACSAS
ncbi:MAG: phage antirepressor KilAC domain-containing protein [Selenomonas sp.]|uniref:phage antirepressor KilAC domain-containing protein n=2 Tax=Selenomonas sp. TaxID=2053611 RepID=UPI0025D8EEF8|nr:phage antirepressor KilAC domain-containing protein [Selenomonas sp.]MCI6086236.1 phage antirepressor KilAC domain-containing protein [Selenomonas sp.]